jgi:hypothetical protein
MVFGATHGFVRAPLLGLFFSMVLGATHGFGPLFYEGATHGFGPLFYEGAVEVLQLRAVILHKEIHEDPSDH